MVPFAIILAETLVTFSNSGGGGSGDGHNTAHTHTLT